MLFFLNRTRVVYQVDYSVSVFDVFKEVFKYFFLVDKCLRLDIF